MTGYLYAVEALGLGLIKLGSTGHPSTRFPSLRNISPVELVIRRVLDCGSVALARLKERELLDMASGSQSHGEWFRAGAVLDDMLDAVAPAVDVTSDFIGLSRPTLGPRRNRLEPGHLDLLSAYHECQLHDAARHELQRRGVERWHTEPPSRLTPVQCEAISHCHRMMIRGACGAAA